MLRRINDGSVVPLSFPALYSQAARLCMRRRDIVALLAGTALALPGAGLAQAKVYRVGLLSGGPPISDTSEDGAALIRNLAQRGYALGRNLLFERRGAMGHPDQLRQLAQDLAAAKVDVIVTWGYLAWLGCQTACFTRLGGVPA